MRTVREQIRSSKRFQARFNFNNRRCMMLYAEWPVIAVRKIFRNRESCYSFIHVIWVETRIKGRTLLRN
jgi:hypothetical protein